MYARMEGIMGVALNAARLLGLSSSCGVWLLMFVLNNRRSWEMKTDCNDEGSQWQCVAWLSNLDLWRLFV